MGGQLVSSLVDQAVAKLAGRQHGVVTFAQLLACGLTVRMIERRVAAGHLHRVYRGVYAVGHTALSNEGRWMAAVLAGGDRAVLSHLSAAEHWGLLKATTGAIHVSIPKAGGRSQRRGLIIHRPSSLISAEITVRGAITVTTPARTIADLRRSTDPEVVRRAIRQANFYGLDIGNDGGDDAGERSELERRFLRLCSRRHLPRPEVNRPIGPYTVDFVWPLPRVCVETDGWNAHRGRQAFEDDHARDLFLQSQGYRVLRFTWRLIENDPASVAEVLRRYLG
jgi:very-short-patch-repair endonuclease